MKTFTSFAVSMVLASAALPSMAASADRENLAQCKSELRRVFGDNTVMKLKSIKRSRDGAHMRIKARPEQGESLMVTCWVDNEGITNMVDKQGVALESSGFDAQSKVSLNN